MNGTAISSLNRNKLASFRNKILVSYFSFIICLPEFSALENVYIPDGLPVKKERGRKERQRTVRNIRRSHRLENKQELSGGEQQRVAVAARLSAVLLSFCRQTYRQFETLQMPVNYMTCFRPETVLNKTFSRYPQWRAGTPGRPYFAHEDSWLLNRALLIVYTLARQVISAILFWCTHISGKHKQIVAESVQIFHDYRIHLFFLTQSDYTSFLPFCIHSVQCAGEILTAPPGRINDFITGNMSTILSISVSKSLQSGLHANR